MNTYTTYYAEKYFYIFACCKIVKGATRAMVYDLNRNEYHFIPLSFVSIADIMREYRFGDLLQMIDADSINVFMDFINYMLEKELGTFVDDISLFPEIDLQWDSPFLITNAIIDEKEKPQDYLSIFKQLKELRCLFIQLRIYKPIDVSYIQAIFSCCEAEVYSFRNIDILTQYKDSIDIHSWTYLHKNYLWVGNIYVYNAPFDRVYETNGRKLYFLTDPLLSEQHCGVIQEVTLQMKGVQYFSELTHRNGCLNQKLSIDADGYICNCPSMKEKYGHISNTALKEVVSLPSFIAKWHIKKMIFIFVKIASIDIFVLTAELIQ